MEQKLQLPPQSKETPHKPPKKDHKNLSNNIKNPLWDCGSTLYDSFELNSFQKKLDSAIINSSRSLSMPRLPSEFHRAPPPPPPPTKKPIISNFSRSFHKLLRSVFKASKNTTNGSKPNYDSSSPSPTTYHDNNPCFLQGQEQEQDKKKVVDNSGSYFVVLEKPNGLSTIPETPEVGFSPDIRSLVRKTMSDRFSFATTSDGIYSF